MGLPDSAIEKLTFAQCVLLQRLSEVRADLPLEGAILAEKSKFTESRSKQVVL